MDKLGFIGELPKPSPVGEGGPRSGFPETSIAQFWGFAMVVDEEFLNVCNYSSVCSPIFDFNNFMHVARIHLLSQEKAYVLAISYIFFVFKHPYKSKFESGRMISSPTIK